MRLMLSLLLLVMMRVSTSAQTQDTLYTIKIFPILNARVDCSNLINPIDPSLLFSIEAYPFVPWVSVVQEAGYVVDMVKGDGNENIVNSFKYRTELRFNNAYRMYDDSFWFNVFLGLNYQYRELTFREEYIFGYECETGDCAYYQNYKGNIPTKRYSYQIWSGAQLFAKRFVMELGYGFGYSYLKIDDERLQEGKIIQENKFLKQSDIGGHLDFYLSYKIGYVIFWKKKAGR